MPIDIQPTTLRKYLENGLPRGTRLLARYLLTEPQSTMGQRFYEEPPEDTPALRRYSELIRRFVKRPLPLDDRGQVDPQVLWMTPEAKQVWVDYHNTCEEKLRTVYAEYQDIAAKSAEQMARLAAIFHVLECDVTGRIEKNNAERAARVAKWFLESGLEVLEGTALSAEEEDAKRLLDYLRAQPERRIKKRECAQQAPGRRLRKSATREAAFRSLLQEGLAREVNDVSGTYWEAVR